VGNLPAVLAMMALVVIDLWRVRGGTEARFVRSGPTDERWNDAAGVGKRFLDKLGMTGEHGRNTVAAG